MCSIERMAGYDGFIKFSWAKYFLVASVDNDHECISADQGLRFEKFNTTL